MSSRVISEISVNLLRNLGGEGGEEEALSLKSLSSSNDHQSNEAILSEEAFILKIASDCRLFQNYVLVTPHKLLLHVDKKLVYQCVHFF